MCLLIIYDTEILEKDLDNSFLSKILFCRVNINRF